MFYAMMLAGASIGFYCGNIYNMRDDMQTLRPTLFMSVPSVLKRYYSRVNELRDGLGKISKSLFAKGYNAKLKAYRKTGKVKSTFWDALVFSKVRKLGGGRLRMIACGGAQISPEYIEFI
jgi:long-chain acyl-CoA synthetase